MHNRVYYFDDENNPHGVEGYFAIPIDMDLPVASQSGDNAGVFCKEEYVYLGTDDEDIACRKLALMIHDSTNDVPEEERDNCFSFGQREWLVLTDEEADEEWDRQLESYLDECVLYSLPELAQTYFDRESWKRDARMDGRGHAVSGYDGHEYEEVVNDTSYYIFRIN